MSAPRTATTVLRMPLPALLGGFVLSIAVFAAITALDRNGDRQKHAQVLVSRLDGRITRLQDIPWDADDAGRNDPSALVRARLHEGAARIRADLRELQRIGRSPMTTRLVADLEQNVELLDLQQRAVAAGNDALANDIADQSGAVAVRLRGELEEAGREFDASAADANRHTFAGTAALLLGLYAAFALALVVLVRTQKQSAAKSQRLRQAQKMEAIGRLAGGIAHDFNNLLLAIRGYGELVEAAIPADTAGVRADIRALIDSTDRASTLTSQLLAFSREQKLTLTVVDANAVVSGVMTLLERLIGEEIEVVLGLADEIPRTECDAGQLGQVILNLALNARDAMPNGGRLTIATGRADVFRSAGQEEAGPWVVLSVSDDGSGIDARTFDRIFDPFFTTRDAGTGLGLATVSGIVAQSGGYIDVDTKLGRGTTFHVYLPATDKPVEGTEPWALPAKQASDGRILVVDDNDTVRLVVSRMLEDRGYLVEEARSGDEALQLFAQAPGRFDLVVTDLAMPGMSGQELGRRLGNVPVLYMSGHPRDFSDDEAGRTAFIQKPFSSADLSQAAGALLA
jgi:two-component system cell cycle sensor histidine kinase/response regulator CckA